MLLQPDGSDTEEGSVDDDSDLEVVDADTGDAQGADEPAEAEGLLMAVMEAEIEPAAPQGAEAQQTRTVAYRLGTVLLREERIPRRRGIGLIG